MMRCVAIPAHAGFSPVLRALPPGVGTNGQISSWGAQLAGAAPPRRAVPIRG